MKLSFLTRVITTSIIILSFVSCGSQTAMVSDVQVQSVTEDSQVFVSMDATLNLGNVSLLDLTLPIHSPKTQENIGTVSIFRNLQGQNKFEVEINVSAIAGIDTSVSTLPNGNVLPLIRNNQVIEIPIQDKAIIYLAFSDGVVALGATVAIGGLDSIGRSVGSISLFPTFNINNVVGSAGVYNSATRGLNGFGLFADISSLVDTNDLISSSSSRSFGASISKSSNFNIVEERESVQLNYNSISPRSSKKRKLNRKLYKLHKKSASL